MPLTPRHRARQINDPTNPRHYWRYRMHRTLEELTQVRGGGGMVVAAAAVQDCRTLLGGLPRRGHAAPCPEVLQDRPGNAQILSHAPLPRAPSLLQHQLAYDVREMVYASGRHIQRGYVGQG